MIIFISFRGVRVDQSPWPKSGLLKMRTKSGLWSILEAERVNIEQPQRKDNWNYDANLNTRPRQTIFFQTHATVFRFMSNSTWNLNCNECNCRVVDPFQALSFDHLIWRKVLYIARHKVETIFSRFISSHLLLFPCLRGVCGILIRGTIVVGCAIHESMQFAIKLFSRLQGYRNGWCLRERQKGRK